MTKDELNKKYFKWMCQLVRNDLHSKKLSYLKFLNLLHSIDFTYTIGLDGNRAEDGIDLRYRFGDEYGYEGPMIATFLDDRSCSVLEMMVALSLRCEEHIMDNPEIGNRTGQWFWSMVKNLGLESMDDLRFDSNLVEWVISRFLNREYGRNGEGGLFTVKSCKRDLRAVEIWYQMCWYLNDTIQNLK